MNIALHVWPKSDLIHGFSALVSHSGQAVIEICLSSYAMLFGNISLGS